MGKSPAQKTSQPASNVETLKPHQGKTVLPDLLSLEQIREYIAKLGDADKAKLGVKVKRDTAKLLIIKEELRAHAAKRLLELIGEDQDGTKALGIVWKAAWPSKYYQLVKGERVKKENGADVSWQYYGGQGKGKPSWLKKTKKDKDGNVVQGIGIDWEQFELIKDDKGIVTEVAITNGDTEEEETEE